MHRGGRGRDGGRLIAGRENSRGAGLGRHRHRAVAGTVPTPLERHLAACARGVPQRWRVQRVRDLAKASEEAVIRLDKAIVANPVAPGSRDDRP